MRADRLLSILLTLQNRKVTTAKILAERLEVSERTIYRDIDALNFSGFPIYSIHGSHGGFVLDKEFHIDVTGVTLPEIKNLLTNRSPGPLRDLGIGLSQLTVNKLIMSLPDSRKDEANQFIKRVYLDSVSWFGGHESVPFLTIIEEALRNNLQIHLDYRKRNGETISREVAPYGLVAKTEAWYLIAKHNDILRVYRVSRICNVKFTEKTFCFPENFHISGFWTAWCHEFEITRPCYPVILRVTREVFHELLVNKDYNFQLKNQGTKDWIVISTQFETFEQALREVLALGSKAEVLKPAALRKSVFETIRQLLRIYK